MKQLHLRITDQLYLDLCRAAKPRKMSVESFAALRLQTDRYDLITKELVREGHLSIGRCDKNENVI